MDHLIVPMISALALTVSSVTAYLTLFRRGTVRMTKPTVVFFGPDGGPTESGHSMNKVFLRTLLYATSKRGRIIENMFVRLRNGEVSQNFNIWVYGDQPLARGSGLFVGENGVACNHHFLLSHASAGFRFGAGKYDLEVYAVLVGDKRTRKLLTIQLALNEELASQMEDPRAGLYFDWGPDSLQYHPHIDLKPEPKMPSSLMEAIVAMRSPLVDLQEPTKRSRTDRVGTADGSSA